MKYQDALLYGKKENKVIVLEALGLPSAEIELDEEAALKPHIAILPGNVIHLWDVDEQEWIVYTPVAEVSGGENEQIATAAQTNFAIPDTILPEDAYKITVTRNGVSIAFLVIGVNEIQIAACEAGDKIKTKWIN